MGATHSLTSTTRLLLIAGFGGLLGLMAVAGVDSMQVARTLQIRNDTIRREFLAKNRLLNQIRSNFYLSGTYLRDYLLEPDPQTALQFRTNLDATRRGMDEALSVYSRQVSGPETSPFATLEAGLKEYWQVLTPALEWDSVQRRQTGYLFLRDVVFPRRIAMLNIADQIENVNERQLNSGNAQLAELFSQFRLRLTITLLLTLVLGSFVAMFSTRKILGLERESNARFDEILQARSELKELSARLVDAQENERRAISRELHDEVGQSLSALLVGLSNLTAAMPGASLSDVLKGHLEGLRKLAESSVAAVRNMALLLRPSMLDDLGLVPALQWQAREVSKRTGMVVNVAADQVPDDLPEEHKTCIYRVVQEALNNISRHAEAHTVRIAVRCQPKRLLLTIQDDGRGFRPALERGLGLVGMQERVTHLGGSFRIDSEPGRGALIAIELPA